MARLTPEQRRIAMISARMTRGDPLVVLRALIAAGLVETNLRHIAYGDRDSQGFLQQRPSMGWGPYIPGVRGIRQDIRDFLARARPLAAEYRGWPGQLAQAVQRSAFPGRYRERLPDANAIIRELRGGAPARGGGAAAPAPSGVGGAGMMLPASTPIRPASLNVQDPRALLGALSPTATSLPGMVATSPLAQSTDDLYGQLRTLRRQLLGIGV